LNNLLNKFRLGAEKEKLETIVSIIDNGVTFRGTNLWILIFAIFVASLGLNVNSTAVIIGAMLISPLMGPIMGIGLGTGINDIALIKKAVYNYLIATVVALITSTLFFLISPLNEAHSEILARTSPTIYDVLIALFGGFAGIIATSSTQKGNVITGVAIATALMPPLCTAGYGLATLRFNFFFGAFYLYIINTVFIALATFMIVRLLHFPYKHLKNKKADDIAKRLVWLIVIITLIPSIYFGYDMIQQTKFTNNANRFINAEVHFQNIYLLNKKIDARERKITLTFGGEEVDSAKIAALKMALKGYSLDPGRFEVKQGFAYLAETRNGEIEQVNLLTDALSIQEDKMKKQQELFDSIKKQELLGAQVFNEVKAQNPAVKSVIIQPSIIRADSAGIKKTVVLLLKFSPHINARERARLESWLKARFQQQDISLIFQ
jgi:uncharacterized hydrophobic protein (TIGR00271 family)